MKKLLLSLLAAASFGASANTIQGLEQVRIADPSFIAVASGLPDGISAQMLLSVSADSQRQAKHAAAAKHRWSSQHRVNYAAPREFIEGLPVFSGRPATTIREAWGHVLAAKRDIANPTKEVLFLIEPVNLKNWGMLQAEKDGRQLVEFGDPLSSVFRQAANREMPVGVCLETPSDAYLRKAALDADPRSGCVFFDNLFGFNIPAGVLTTDDLGIRFMQGDARRFAFQNFVQEGVIVGVVATPRQGYVDLGPQNGAPQSNRAWKANSIVLIDAFELKLIDRFPVPEKPVAQPDSASQMYPAICTLPVKQASACEGTVGFVRTTR